jgi:hypothetical protein
LKSIDVTIRIPVAKSVGEELETSTFTIENRQDGKVIVEIDGSNPALKVTARKRNVASRKSEKYPNHENRANIQQFIATKCDVVVGAKIPFGEFRKQFCETTRLSISRKAFSRDLPDEHPSKPGTGNVSFVRNVQWRKSSVSVSNLAIAV